MKKREGIGDRKGAKAPPTTGERKSGFKSAVVGLEDHIFEYGSPKHVAKFVKTQKQIANYIQKKYDKGGAEIASTVRTLVMPNIGLPTEPDPTTATLIEMEIWKNQYRRADKKWAMLKDNAKRAYALIYDQYSLALQTKLKGQESYNDVEVNQDVVGLMELIRGICCKYDASSEQSCHWCKPKGGCTHATKGRSNLTMNMPKSLRHTLMLWKHREDSLATSPGT